MYLPALQWYYLLVSDHLTETRAATPVSALS